VWCLSGRLTPIYTDETDLRTAKAMTECGDPSLRS
jgi:hypothetical protein